MSAFARTGSFVHEAAAGFVLSAAAGALGAALAFALPADELARGLIAALGLACLLRVLMCSSETTGRVVIVTAWCVTGAALWLAAPALPVYALAHALMLSLARSLYLHGRLVEAAMDAALTLLALGFAAWAAARSESVFLTAWSFFLVQAMHVAIPALAARLVTAGAAARPRGAGNRRFSDALGAADEALRRIAARR